MKKKMRRLVSFILALFLVLSLLPTSALAEETADQTTTEKGIAYFASETEQVLGEGRIEGSVTRKPVYADKDNGYYTDVEEAIALLRERMVDRRSVIEIPLRVSKAEVSASDLQALIEVIFAMAVAHTGVEDQGDYLLWSVAERGYDATYTETGSYYYLDIPYEITYYTTLEQEVSVGRKLDSIFASFGFTEQTDDYTKIKTIYDYICANVTYDYANLENDAYTLKYTAYAALNNGTSVCQGYATLLYRMLLRAGIDCRVIIGVDDTNTGHAWNIVALDGRYYNMDSTWDAGNDEYQYFLKGTADFPDHYRDETYDSAEFHILYPMAALGYSAGEAQVVAQGTCGEGVNWVLMSDGILTVSGNGAMDDYVDIIYAPWYDYRDYVLGVVVEEGVSHVGDRAFATYTKLQVISCAARSIGQSAFSHCDSLVAAELAEGLEEIGASAFYGCDILTAVSFPTSLQSVGEYAFYGCRGLVAVGITDLAAWCSIDFSGREANPLSQSADLYINEELIHELVIPEGVTQIKPYAFTEGNFTSVTLPAGVKSIEGYAFYRAKMTEANLPVGLESIGESAFSMCEALRRLTVPEGVKTIGESAFYAAGLQEIHLPSTLESISGGAFSAGLTMDLYITDLSAWCGVSLADRYSNPLWYGGNMYLDGVKVTQLVIPDGVEEIKPFTFYNGTYTAVTIPSSVKTIGNSAFAESDVADVTLPEGLLVLGEAAFDGCQNLKELVLPETLTTISLAALRYTQIETIQIPSSVTVIGDWSLSNNYYLNAVYFNGNAPSFGNQCFSGGEMTVYYPAGNSTWTEEVRQNYGGNITWVAACTAHSFENGVCTICGEKDPNFNPEGLLGDADGSGVVDYVDAMLVLQYHTGVITNEALTLAQCDVDGSGAVDYVDAMRILQYHTGVISGF